MKRRDFLLGSASAIAAAGLTRQSALAQRDSAAKNPWPLCLNASTIRPTPVAKKIEVAAEAGFDAVELWTRDLEEWVEGGEKLSILRKRIEDAGLFVSNVIGLWDCMPEGDDAYRKALDASKKRMEMAAEAGSHHIAVLPLPDRTPFDLHYATEKYRELLELGLNEFGVHPAMEFVSVFKGLRRLGEAVAIAIDSDHPQARIIPDTFHMYNGGSGFDGLRHIRGDLIATFHWNDVATGMPPGNLSDSDRILPGEGALPLVESLRVLRDIGYTGPLSLELFRREHYQMDPLDVAKLGVDALRRNVAAALA